MFNVDTSELLLIALVALVVIGPKDLPKAMRVVGYWVGRARGVMNQVRSGFDTMMREAELKELEEKWAKENERIMRETALIGASPVPVEPGEGDPPPVMTPMPIMTDTLAMAAAPAAPPPPTTEEIEAAIGLAPSSDQPK
jgi:sec-independent protein translocase protein TatB